MLLSGEWVGSGVEILDVPPHSSCRCVCGCVRVCMNIIFVLYRGKFSTDDYSPPARALLGTTYTSGNTACIHTYDASLHDLHWPLSRFVGWLVCCCGYVCSIGKGMDGSRW